MIRGPGVRVGEKSADRGGSATAGLQGPRRGYERCQLHSSTWANLMRDPSLRFGDGRNIEGERPS